MTKRLCHCDTNTKWVKAALAGCLPFRRMLFERLLLILDFSDISMTDFMRKKIEDDKNQAHFFPFHRQMVGP